MSSGLGLGDGDGYGYGSESSGSGSGSGSGSSSDDDRDDDDIITSEMEYQLQGAMSADDAQGGTGEWVGLLGFSQGARVAGSILFDRQLKIEAAGLGLRKSQHVDLLRNSMHSAPAASVPGFAGGYWAFGILIAGQGPFLTLSEAGEMSGMTEAPGVLPNFKSSPPRSPNGSLTLNGTNGMPNMHKLNLPTLHIHGLKDPMQASMRRWYDAQFEKGKADTGDVGGCAWGARLIEWSGNHRLPFRSMDMLPIVRAIECMGGV